jgi:hypothetical protein
MTSGFNPNQKSHITYNQNQANKATSNISLESFEESYYEKLPIAKEQIWQDSDRIPGSNPLKSDGIADGTTYSDSGDLIITKYHQRELDFLPGSYNSFYDSTGTIVQCIPPGLFGVDYQIKVWKRETPVSAWIPIPLGQNEWMFNYQSGVLTFLNGLPDFVSTSAPTNIGITAYKYEGAIGLTSSGSGTQGYQGATGIQGINGPQGLQGTQGVQGVQGSQGLQGVTGVGVQGPQGRIGPQGLQGIQGGGTQGSQGIQGSQGSQGAQGSQGFQGSQGSQGNQGDLGSQGNQGDLGTQGNQGDIGAQGNDGDQGPQGPCPPCPPVSTTNSIISSNHTATTLADEDLLKIQGSQGGTFNLVGINVSTPIDGQQIYISNETDGSMVITHDSGLVGSNPYKIITPTGTNITLVQYACAHFIYSSTAAGSQGRWQYLA